LNITAHNNNNYVQIQSLIKIILLPNNKQIRLLPILIKKYFAGIISKVSQNFADKSIGSTTFTAFRVFFVVVFE
jgi:hypothetical protein